MLLTSDFCLGEEGDAQAAQEADDPKRSQFRESKGMVNGVEGPAQKGKICSVAGPEVITKCIKAER